MRTLITFNLGLLVTFVATSTLVGQSSFQNPNLSNAPSLNATTGEPTYPLSVRSLNARQDTSADFSIHFFTFGEVDETKRATIKEDATVLNHLISQALPVTAQGSALGVRYRRAHGDNQIFVIDGKGIIVVYHVGISLAPIQSGVASDQPQAEALNPWEQAKRDLEERHHPNAESRYFAIDTNLGNGVSPFDPDAVSRIEMAVKQALQYAGNFRGLNQGDTITVYAYGPQTYASTGAAVRTGMSWRATLEGLESDKPIPFEKIESHSFVESVVGSANSNFLQLGGGVVLPPSGFNSQLPTPNQPENPGLELPQPANLNSPPTTPTPPNPPTGDVPDANSKPTLNSPNAGINSNIP